MNKKDREKYELMEFTLCKIMDILELPNNIIFKAEDEKGNVLKISKGAEGKLEQIDFLLYKLMEQLEE